MEKIKKFVCNEHPGVLSAYIIVSLLVFAEFCMMGWNFILVVLGGLVCGVILVGIGYGLMLVIKKLQENCDV